jgi:hypothetical protein
VFLSKKELSISAGSVFKYSCWKADRLYFRRRSTFALVKFSNCFFLIIVGILIDGRYFISPNASKAFP